MRYLKWTIGLFFIVAASVAWGQSAAENRLTQAQLEQAGSERVANAPEAPAFQSRSTSVRKPMESLYGGTKAADRAVAAALDWIARHQNPDGSWSLHNYAKFCQDGSCSGSGSIKSNIAATSLALLPFLGADKTLRTQKESYKKTISSGLAFLLKSEKGKGDLRGANGDMFTQTLATMTLCEAFGMTQDKELGDCAQRAIKFIEHTEAAREDREPSDVLLIGWEVITLQSAVLAKLNVGETLVRLQQRLKAATDGSDGDAAKESSLTLLGTSIELLCAQYLGAKRDDPAIIKHMKNLMASPPMGGAHNAYYWYFVTMGMRNVSGADRDRWHRRMKRIVIDSQVRNGCAAGSWAPQGHVHCQAEGRILVTSLCALALEVESRYRPRSNPAATEETFRRDLNE